MSSDVRGAGHHRTLFISNRLVEHRASASWSLDVLGGRRTSFISIILSSVGCHSWDVGSRQSCQTCVLPGCVRWSVGAAGEDAPAPAEAAESGFVDHRLLALLLREIGPLAAWPLLSRVEIRRCAPYSVGPYRSRHGRCCHGLTYAVGAPSSVGPYRSRHGRSERRASGEAGHGLQRHRGAGQRGHLRGVQRHGRHLQLHSGGRGRQGQVWRWGQSAGKCWESRRQSVVIDCGLPFVGSGGW